MARLVVRVAVRMLPSTLRDRYREQWGSDLRDAAEAGIPTSEIAWGSLAFATTLNRSAVEGLDSGISTLDRRARLASALALSAAVVMLSQFASIGLGGGLTGQAGYDFLVQFFGPLLIGLYAVAAPLVAVILVLSTRGMYRAVRVAVMLLVLATLAPLAAPLLDSGGGPVENIYFTPGTATFAVALGLIAVALTLMAREFRWWVAAPAGSPRQGILAAGGALPIWLAAAVGVWFAFEIRSGVFTTSTAFLADLRESATEGIGEFVAIVDRASAESLILIIAWGVIAAALGAVVIVAGITRRLSRRRLAVLLAVVLSVGAISFAGLTSYLQLTAFAGMDSSGPVVYHLLLLLGRVALIAALLWGVGGVRLTRAADAQLATA